MGLSDKEPKIKELSFEKKATVLQDYIKSYIPSNWIEPVGRVDAVSIPIFLPDDIKELEYQYRSGNLGERLEATIKKWYIREAIMIFFKTNYNNETDS